jgi:hypothetical protein
MPAPFIELYVDQGSSFNNIINITDDTTNAVVNISGYSAMSQMRRSHYSTSISANIECTITDSANGELTMSLPADVTSNIKAGRYVFDVKITDTSNVTSRLIEGMITVTPACTK